MDKVWTPAPKARYPSPMGNETHGKAVGAPAGAGGIPTKGDGKGPRSLPRDKIETETEALQGPSKIRVGRGTRS